MNETEQIAQQLDHDPPCGFVAPTFELSLIVASTIQSIFSNTFFPGIRNRGCLEALEYDLSDRPSRLEFGMRRSQVRGIESRILRPPFT